MRPDWHLPAQFETIGEIASTTIKLVLLEYDGPQMVVRSDGNLDHLALAVDEDEAAVRWIQARISKLELDALLLGAQPVREAFRKPRLTVVDYDRESEAPLYSWTVDLAAVPESVLPQRGVVLRDPVSQTADSVESPLLRFGGKGAAKDGVTLPQLSALAGTLHEVWTAIVQESFGVANPRPFTAVASATGSLALEIHADDASLFERVAKRYAALVRAADDVDTLSATLARTPAAIVTAYQKHLNAIEKQHAEVLTQWRSGSVFLGHDAAETALETYGIERRMPPTTQTVTRTHRGYFDGFWPRGPRARFDFYDVDANESFTGRIGKDIRREWGKEPLTLRGRYQITVLTDMSEAGEIAGRTLLGFLALPDVS